MVKKISVLCTLLLVLSFGIVNAAETVGEQQPAMNASVQLGNAYIPSGTDIAVELTRDVNSKQTFVGEVLEIRVLEDIVLDNTVVIPKDALGYVTVTKLRTAGEWGKNGGIELQPQYVKSANWIKVPLAQGITKNGNSHDVIRPFGTGLAGAAGATSLEGLAGVAGLFLFYIDPTPGTNAMIPSGTKFIVTTDGDVDLKVTPAELAYAMTVDVNKRGMNQIIDKQNWTGTYSTNRGKMVLTQNGNKVVGTYERGSGIIEGTVENNRLTGKWSEEISSVAPSGQGYFDFVMSPAGKSVMFSWRHEFSENWVEDKCANRVNYF